MPLSPESIWMFVFLCALAYVSWNVVALIRVIIIYGINKSAAENGRQVITLVSIGSWTLAFAIIIGLIVMINRLTLKIPESVFTGVTTALAAGIAFGSQYLFRDVEHGIVTYVEKQVRVGDWIDIQPSSGEKVSGTVEHVTLRAITINTLNKVRIVMPFSQIVYISNSSSGAQRTTVDIIFPVDAPIDRIEAVVDRALETVKRDCEGMIISEPQVLFATVTQGINLSIRCDTEPETRILVESAIRKEIAAEVEKESFDLQVTPLVGR